MSRLVSALCFPFVLLSFANGLQAEPLDAYAGQYILRLGSRNFLVLQLEDQASKLSGSLQRPRHASLGWSFSHISSEVISERIVSAALEAGRLHLKAKEPGETSSTDEFEMQLLASNKASLQLKGTPIDAWTLVRVPAKPAQQVATDWDPHSIYYPDETEQSNPEMQRIMDEDQKPRQSMDMSHADWAAINKGDEERQRQVRALLGRGALHTGKDFEQAAFVFQHGDSADDYLLAHTLAMAALARGNAGALWIATATLDRYLNAIKQPQIFGTQFHSGTWTQEPYNRTLISDELRRQLGVPTQAVQEQQLKDYKAANSHEIK